MAWIERVDRRTRRGKLWQDSIDPAKFAIDVSLGSMHYPSGADWLDIDTNWEADTGAWQYRMLKNAFQLHARNVLNAGDTIQWLDPTTGETVMLQPLALNWVDNVTDSRQQITQPQAVTATVQGNQLYWANGYGTGRHFRYTADNDRLVKELIIDSAANLPAPTVSNPYLEIEFILKKSAGVGEYINGVLWDRTTKTTTTQAIEFRQTANGPAVWAFRAPTARDSSGRRDSSTGGIMTLRRSGATRYVTVRFPKTWIDQAVFPIALDPTIDETVPADTDDGYVYEPDSTLYYTAGDMYVADESGANCWAGMRFTTVAIPAGATIGSNTYITLRANGKGGAPANLSLYAEDADSPATWGTTHKPWNGANGVTPTTATVAWNPATWTTSSDYNSPDISSIIKEIVDRAGWSSNNSLAILWWPTADKAGSNYYAFIDYCTGISNCAKLHVEYTEGGGTSTPMTLTGAITPSGTVSKSIGSTKAGGITPSGTLAKALNLVRTLVGASTPTGTVTKSIGQAKAGSITPSGTLTKSSPRTFTGAVTPAGVLSRVVSLLKTLTGGITPSGTLTKSSPRTLTGTITPTGALAYLKAMVRAFAGAITPSGSLGHGLSRTLTGQIDPSGTLGRALNIVRTFVGEVTLAGSFVGNKIGAGVTNMTLVGSVAIAGTVTWSLNLVRTLSGAITPTGILSRTISIGRTLTGAVSSTGTLAKRIGKSLSGAVSSSGVLNYLKATVMVFTGSITPTGTLSKLLTIIRTFTGSINPAGTLSYIWNSLVSAIVFPERGGWRGSGPSKSTIRIVPDSLPPDPGATLMDSQNWGSAGPSPVDPTSTPGVDIPDRDKWRGS